MALSHNELQVTWNVGSNSDTITGVAAVTSDVLTLTATAIARSILVKSDMITGTPAAGDKTYFYLLGTCGDPDGAAADEFPSGKDDGLWLATIDHSAIDPGRVVVSVPVPLKACRIYAETVGLDAGDIVTVSACILETLSA